MMDKKILEEIKRTHKVLGTAYSDFFDLQVPDQFYHYTTAIGLYWNYNSRPLLASSSHFVNNRKDII